MVINTNNRYKTSLNSYNVDVILLRPFVKHHLPNNRYENEIEYPLNIRNRQNSLNKTTRLSIVHLFLEMQNDKLSPKNYTGMLMIQPLTNSNTNVPLDQIQMSISLLDGVVLLSNNQIVDRICEKYKNRIFNNQSRYVCSAPGGQIKKKNTCLFHYSHPPLRLPPNYPSDYLMHSFLRYWRLIPVHLFDSTNPIMVARRLLNDSFPSSVDFFVISPFQIPLRTHVCGTYVLDKAVICYPLTLKKNLVAKYFGQNEGDSLSISNY